MKDVNKGLRTAIYTALTGTVVYDSVVIPIADGKISAKRFLRFVDQQTQTLENNDGVFVTTATLTIEIVDKTFDEVSKDVLDDIGELVTQILLPTPFNVGITPPAGFQYGGAEISTRTVDIGIDSVDSIIRKLIIFSITIIQQ